MTLRTPTPTPTELAATLARIGLRSTAVSLDAILAKATHGQWSHKRLLEEIALLENQDKARRSLDRRLVRSKIGRFKPIADFEWGWPKQIDRALIERALTLDFLVDGRNLVLVGGNGLGKTMIAKNIAHTAVLAGYCVLQTTAAQLIDHLQCDSPEMRRRRLAKYIRPQLLCIDEVGYLAFDDHAADLLYRVLGPRCEDRRSTLITTNLGFKQWNIVFPNATCITTIVDRLTHHADVTRIQGESYRAHESEHEAAVRKRQRATAPTDETATTTSQRS